MRRTNDTSAAAARADQPMNRTDEFRWLDPGSTSDFERRWHAVQAEFVEDPRKAVAEAGGLIADLMDHIGKNLRGRRGELDRNSGETDTEVMRQEMRRYKELVNNVLGRRETQSSTMPARTEPTPRMSQEQPRPEAPRKND